MALFPSFELLIGFVLATIVVAITPGPDMTLLVSRAIRMGRVSGLVSLAGVQLGLIIHSLLAAFGLSAILATSATAFTVIKVVGGVYLLWLAFKILRNGSELNEVEGAVAKISLGKVFATGFLVNILNPKIVLFFLTFLPQFVDSSHPNASYQLLALSMVFASISAFLNLLIVLTAHQFSSLLRRSKLLSRGLDYLLSTVMGGFALRILAADV